MTKDDILRMAREAAKKHGHTLKDEPSPETMEFIVELVNMVAAKAAEDEREACAMECNELTDGFREERRCGCVDDPHQALREGAESGAMACAAAIRARRAP